MDELRVRSVQALHARLEALGFSSEVREPDAATLRRLLHAGHLTLPRGEDAPHVLRAHVQQRGARHFLAGVADRSAGSAVLRARWPHAAAELVARAYRITSGYLELFGREIFVGARPDWLRDPLSGVRAPLVHWRRIAFLDPRVAGDCKRTWEINRHQHLVTLGRAYWLTADERYAGAFATQLESWLDTNPSKRGINWTSSLEVALRAIAWLWALHLFRDSPRLDDRLLARALQSLHVHGRHLESYLSTYFSPNTHLTGEALGLLYLGVALPELRRAPRWRATGARILEAELARQLRGDGVYFEQSTYYHRYTADFYLHALILAEAAGMPLARAIRPGVQALADYLLHITRPDGSTPLVGDDDGGRLLELGHRAANDFRDTLGVAAVVLQRGDLAHVAGEAPEELLWLLGPAGVQAFGALPATAPAATSRAFAESGYYVMRDRWDQRSDYALVRCGPHGALTGAHAHADALALELAIAGRPMLVDSGTYSYDPSTADRDLLRRAAAHNTLTVDGRSSSEPGASPFTWRSVARSTANAWLTHAAFDFFDGEHDGYGRPGAPVVHRRAVLHVRGAYWVIRDSIIAGEDEAHRVALHLHWSPGVRVRLEGDRLLAASAGDGGPELRVQVCSDAGCFFCESGWVSPSYGVRQAATVCTFRRDGSGTQELLTVLAPAGVLRGAPGSVRRVRTGALLTLPTESGNDVLAMAAPGAPGVESAGVLLDGAWAWIRRAPGVDGEPTRCVALGVRRLQVDGELLVDAAHTLAYAVGRRVAGGWEWDVAGGEGVVPAVARVAASDAGRMHESCAVSVE